MKFVKLSLLMMLSCCALRAFGTNPDLISAVSAEDATNEAKIVAWNAVKTQLESATPEQLKTLAAELAKAKFVILGFDAIGNPKIAQKMVSTTIGRLVASLTRSVAAEQKAAPEEPVRLEGEGSSADAGSAGTLVLVQAFIAKRGVLEAALAESAEQIGLIEEARDASMDANASLQAEVSELRRRLEAQNRARKKCEEELKTISDLLGNRE